MHSIVKLNHLGLYFIHPLIFSCNYSGESIDHVRSVYIKAFRDRSWSFQCKSDSRITSSCKIAKLNSVQGELLYQCPNGVLAGQLIFPGIFCLCNRTVTYYI